jgi:DNA-binding response OmpR family regulator
MPAPSSRQPRRILLADDDAGVQLAVQRVAAKRGHEVISATRGARVVESAARENPDIVVLDIEFPDADGRDLLAELKRDPRTAHIPVLIWSGRKGHASDSRISLELGAEDYVEKSDAQLLIRKVERTLLKF